MTRKQTNLVSKESLGDLLGKLAPIDDDLPSEEFDPAVVVGDIRDKVDALKWRMDDWEYKAKMLHEQWVKPLQRKIKSLRGKKERLKDYMKEQMKFHGFTKLPGNAVRAQLNPMADKLVIDQEVATFSDYKAYPGLVKQVVIYEWDNEAIKERLKSGETLSFARLEEVKRLDFYGQESIQITGETSDEHNVEY